MPPPPAPLFTGGLDGAGVDEFRRRVRRVAERAVLPRRPRAERSGRFPIAALRACGRAGLLAERWAGGPHGDSGRAVVMAEELGAAGCGSLAVGLGIHTEAVISILRTFGRHPLAADYLRRATAGDALGCMALTEEGSGSDLSGVATEAARESGGWRVRGVKEYVSLAPAADFALVLCRLPGAEAAGDGVRPLVLALVPGDQFRVLHVWRTLGLRGLGTARIDVDALVPDGLVLGRPGAGLLVATWGLTHERLAGAAGLLGAASLALRLATAHAFTRRRFGVRLIDHQALRLRIAELTSELTMLRLAVYAAASCAGAEGLSGPREIAGLKAAGARLAQRVIDECLHLLGGGGYLDQDGSLGQVWRDARLGRLGGGTDEMMWELVAGGLAAPEAGG